MKRETLEKPFEEKLIKTRRGHTGKQLSYVEGHEYIRRLNEAFDGQWSFEIKDYQIHDSSVVVMGRLIAGEVVKEAFGGSSVVRDRETGGPLNLADDLKAAATDALKKASSLLGLGLHMYGDDADDEVEPDRMRSTSRSTANLTDRQLKAIMAIGQALGWTPDSLRQHCVDAFGVPPEELTKADASTFISELQEMTVKSAA